jgi:hypothetical protein
MKKTEAVKLRPSLLAQLTSTATHHHRSMILKWSGRARSDTCHFKPSYWSSASSSVPECLYYPLPQSFLTPFAVSSVDRLPRPKFLFRQIPPRVTASQNPQHPCQYCAVVTSRPSLGRLLRRHKRPEELPLLIGEMGRYRCTDRHRRGCGSREIR